jgi:hypothetical protein
MVCRELGTSEVIGTGQFVRLVEYQTLLRDQQFWHAKCLISSAECRIYLEGSHNHDEKGYGHAQFTTLFLGDIGDGNVAGVSAICHGGGG